MTPYLVAAASILAVVLAGCLADRIEGRRISLGARTALALGGMLSVWILRLHP